MKGEVTKRRLAEFRDSTMADVFPLQTSSLLMQSARVCSTACISMHIHSAWISIAELFITRYPIIYRIIISVNVPRNASRKRRPNLSKSPRSNKNIISLPLLFLSFSLSPSDGKLSAVFNVALDALISPPTRTSYQGVRYLKDGGSLRRGDRSSLITFAQRDPRKRDEDSPFDSGIRGTTEESSGPRNGERERERGGEWVNGLCRPPTKDK